MSAHLLANEIELLASPNYKFPVILSMFGVTKSGGSTMAYSPVT
jgi:hypothetical protein